MCCRRSDYPGAQLEKNADCAFVCEQGPESGIGLGCVAESISQKQLTVVLPEHVKT